MTLRLRSRVAALLATDDGPARALFEDVGQLYSCARGSSTAARSRRATRAKMIGGISTVPAENLEYRFAVALGHAVDRMRDLVRRAILARLALAARPVGAEGIERVVDGLHTAKLRPRTAFEDVSPAPSPNAAQLERTPCAPKREPRLVR